MGLVNQAPTRMLPWEVAEQLKGCKRCMDEHKCIFDAPEHLVQKILQVRNRDSRGGVQHRGGRVGIEGFRRSYSF